MLPFKSRQVFSFTKLPNFQIVNCCRLNLTLAATKPAIQGNDETDREWKNAKPYHKIPGPRVLPVLGTSWQFLPGIGKYEITKMRLMQLDQHKRFGDIWKDVFPVQGDIVVVTDPQDVEKLFRNEGKFPLRPSFETLKAYRRKRAEYSSTGGTLIENGQAWWTIRSKVQQTMLKADNLLSYLTPLEEIAEELVTRVRALRNEENEAPEDFLNELYKWALESVALVAMNKRLGCLDPDAGPDSEPQRMIKATNDSFFAFSKLELGLPLWKYFETPMWKKLVEAQDFFTDTSLKYIHKTLEELKERPIDPEGKFNLLENLLLRGLSVQEAVVMVVDMLSAGIDTTSHTMAFLLYFLAKHPEKQEKLREEILSVVPRGTPVTPQHISQLAYMKACIKESLRLQPATSSTVRITTKDLVLAGYQIPQGTFVIPASQLMCRLEKHFPDPESYVPERWVKGHPLYRTAHPYVMLPFGFGGRLCLGRRLAEQEMWLLTIKMMQNFKLEYHYGEMDCITRFINIPDKPLKFKFIDISR